MKIVKTTLFAAIIALMGSQSSAQTCEELCDGSFWQSASSAEIMAVIVNADIAARDELDLTSLHFAAGLGTPESIVALLSAGADGRARTHDGKTAFELASENDKVKGTDAYWALKDAQY